MRYFLDIDPGGCWVAVDGGDVAGFAISQNRDRLWYLATYGVLPGRQGQGIGKRLMEAALAHGGGRPGPWWRSPWPLLLDRASRGDPAGTGWPASRCTRRCE
jgi:GNAT superfamily N-acetyltransferase